MENQQHQAKKHHRAEEAIGQQIVEPISETGRLVAVLVAGLLYDGGELVVALHGFVHL